MSVPEKVLERLALLLPSHDITVGEVDGVYNLLVDGNKLSAVWSPDASDQIESVFGIDPAVELAHVLACEIRVALAENTDESCTNLYGCNCTHRES